MGQTRYYALVLDPMSVEEWITPSTVVAISGTRWNVI
jgi:hypothetical protein